MKGLELEEHKGKRCTIEAYIHVRGGIGKEGTGCGPVLQGNSILIAGLVCLILQYENIKVLSWGVCVIQTHLQGDLIAGWAVLHIVALAREVEVDIAHWVYDGVVDKDPQGLLVWEGDGECDE